MGFSGAQDLIELTKRKEKKTNSTWSRRDKFMKTVHVFFNNLTHNFVRRITSLHASNEFLAISPPDTAINTSEKRYFSLWLGHTAYLFVKFNFQPH